MYGKRTNGTYGSWEDISYMTSPVGYGDPQVAPSLMAMYAEGDVRLKTFRTDEAGESGCWWTSKYAGKGDNLYQNVPFAKDQKIFESGVNYFK